VNGPLAPNNKVRESLGSVFVAVQAFWLNGKSGSMEVTV